LGGLGPPAHELIRDECFYVLAIDHVNDGRHVRFFKELAEKFR
jgi:hypothetical protein